MRLPAARDAWRATRRDRGVPRCRLFYETQLGAETAKPPWPNVAPCQMRKATPSRLSRRTCSGPSRCSQSIVRTKKLRAPCAATAALRWSRSPPTMASRIQPTQNLPPLGNELALAARAANRSRRPYANRLAASCSRPRPRTFRDRDRGLMCDWVQDRGRDRGLMRNKPAILRARTIRRNAKLRRRKIALEPLPQTAAAFGGYKFKQLPLRIATERLRPRRCAPRAPVANQRHCDATPSQPRST